MKDYIEREKVLELLRKWADGYSYVEIEAASAIRGITAIPAADVRPVVRGKWEQKEVFTAKGNVDMLQSAFCPACQRYHTAPYSYYFTHYNFCPNCGACMRTERDG